jgi:hypothetical protein
MTRRLLESLRGIGDIYAGDVLLRTTPYELSLWSDDESPAPGDDPATSTSVDGHIDITGIAEAVVLAGPGTLTLKLQDGRRMAIKLTTSTGAIVGRGWLPSA